MAEHELTYHFQLTVKDMQNMHENHSRTLFSDFKGLFESKKFTDFTVEVENEEIPVHKAILAGK
jgi:hypothetical protein